MHLDIEDDEEIGLILRRKAADEISNGNYRHYRSSKGSFTTDDDLFDTKIKHADTPSSIPRSFECQKLLNRYCLLREWNDHNSQKDAAMDRKPSLVPPMMTYGDGQRLKEENFANDLTSKLSMIEEDPEERLKELEHRVQLHSYAMLRIFIERGFDMGF